MTSLCPLLNEASPKNHKIKKQRIEIKGVSREAAKRAKKNRGPELSILSLRLCVFATLRENWV